ncbi:hypothetical protein [Nocardioides daeguensis]|uniref:ARB-07466-like C-terminal domain-containing protein n=1 Tax=Nocardioides daeguensis TaxID=908359 RepID=A0ABP6V1U0_9ACTN|nr:hypothetical protein [Nocardioides daeguensis]MBV6727116.1 hypothetical protein [Nocardioides daeguensis]MCR1771481.1 hypothetical protein [Nocardioides daeguensis]
MSVVRALLAAALVATALTLLPASGAVADNAPIEDYAPYEPPTRCAPHDRTGTRLVARWTVRRFGGGFGGISRACGATPSEHAEGRAFDWAVDVRSRADRRRVRRLLAALFAPDAAGNPAALARRMGVMYVIWDDTSWASWRRFAPAPYLSTGCPTRRECSRTLRHRDHVHISLTRAASRGKLSWYAGRVGR